MNTTILAETSAGAKIQEILKKHKAALVISRLPEQTKTEFKEFAEKEFCSDYGMCLKFLLDYFKADLKNVDMLQRIMALEEKTNKSESKTIKTLDGKEIRKGDK